MEILSIDAGNGVVLSVVILPSSLSAHTVMGGKCGSQRRPLYFPAHFGVTKDQISGADVRMGVVDGRSAATGFAAAG
jgi:hypothetical protein